MDQRLQKQKVRLMDTKNRSKEEPLNQQPCLSADIKKYLKELDDVSPEQRINDRIEKFCEMGVWK